jgi:hypothetical protein
MKSIIGFLVVRIPSANYDLMGRGAFSSKLLHLGGILYEGFDRMAWFDVDEAILGGKLSQQLVEARNRARAADFSGIDIVKVRVEAESLLAAANHEMARNEIIVLNSKMLAQLKGETLLPASEVEWIGYDVAPAGNSSLLLNGIFVRPDLFRAPGEVLNEHGLLRSVEDADRYIAECRALATRNLLEPVDEEPYPVEAIRVGRLSKLAGLPG